MNNSNLSHEEQLTQLENSNKELMQILDKVTIQLGQKDIRIAQLEVLLSNTEKFAEKLQVEQSKQNKEMSE